MYTKTPSSKLHYTSITNNEITIELFRNCARDGLISRQTLENQEITRLKTKIGAKFLWPIQQFKLQIQLQLINVIILPKFLAKESRRIKIKILSLKLSKLSHPDSDRVPIEFSCPSFPPVHIFAELIGSSTRFGIAEGKSMRSRARAVTGFGAGSAGLLIGRGGKVDRGGRGGGSRHAVRRDG